MAVTMGCCARHQQCIVSVVVAVVAGMRVLDTDFLGVVNTSPDTDPHNVHFIAPVHYNLDGIYVCQVFTNAATANASYNLHVVGQSVSLTCQCPRHHPSHTPTTTITRNCQHCYTTTTITTHCHHYHHYYYYHALLLLPLPSP
ncbi:hypothetical protein E2C01_078711 [Portunus trituberculatus]|uniref:Uncharacterized protein n=1 Tax=Portunus trituberculatus TaxID=210409 RepID=A0A5B7IQY8_PORTR|nr:hypothetical protein [Portunus trituberculatus]